MVGKSKSLLLLDNRIINSTHGVESKLGTVQKHSANPLFVEAFFADPPKKWEARYDNLYPTVLYDEEEDIFKLWYHIFLYDEDSNKTALAQRPFTPYTGGRREDGVLYATSKDGIHWEKPNVGLIEFDGSTENNIIMSLTSHGIHSGGVIKEPHDPDPSRRYKYFHRNPRAQRMAVAFSEDGLRWTEPILWPEHNAVGDAHNNALWVPELQKYVGFSRGWTEGAYKGLRTVVRTDSSDFIHWSDPVEIMQGADDHDQIYSMPVCRYGDVFIGLPSLFHKGNPLAKDWDTVTTELAWSPDSFAWHRICEGTPLIPLGAGAYPTGEYDCGCIYAASPLKINDEVWIYYGGSNGLHNNWREGSFNLATLPRDRFAGYAPKKGDVGRIETMPLLVEEDTLTLNVDVQPGGSIRVEVLGEDGFGLEDCVKIREGGLDTAVQWQNKKFTDLKGQTVQLIFELRNAHLFAFSGCARQ